MTYTVRPTHPLLPILCPGLGHWWSPLGLGRVVEVYAWRPVNDQEIIDGYADDALELELTYTSDGPSLGPVTARTMAWAPAHDDAYRHAPYPRTGPDADEMREFVDMISREYVQDGDLGWWGAKEWQWRLASPLLRLAWRYRWGGWQDLPARLWWSCATVYGATVWGLIALAALAALGG